MITYEWMIARYKKGYNEESTKWVTRKHFNKMKNARSGPLRALRATPTAFELYLADLWATKVTFFSELPGVFMKYRFLGQKKDLSQHVWECTRICLIISTQMTICSKVWVLSRKFNARRKISKFNYTNLHWQCWLKRSKTKVMNMK